MRKQYCCHFYLTIWNLQSWIKLYLIILIIISRLIVIICIASLGISFSLLCPIFWAIQEGIIVLPIVTIFTVYFTTIIITVFTTPIFIILIFISTISFSFFICSSTISIFFIYRVTTSIIFIWSSTTTISITFISFSLIIGIIFS